jgi:hypothetical protein
MSPEELAAQMADGGGLTFTPWFKLEWARIWRDHRSAVLSLA